MSDLLVPDLLTARAASDPRAVALIGDAGEPLTFGRWRDDANALARGLSELGVAAGDRVALWFAGTDWADYAVAYLGTLKAGAVAVPLSPRLTGAEVAAAMRTAGCAGVVSGGAGSSGAGSGWTGPGWRVGCRTLIGDRDRDHYQVPRAGTDLAEILHSSGTTGVPKLVAASHENVLAGWRPGDSAAHDPARFFVHATPMATNAGQVTLLHSLKEPHTCVVMAEFDAVRYCDLLVRHRAVHTLLVPAMAGWLVDSGAPRERDLSCVETVVLTSAAAPPALLSRVAEAFPAATIMNCYTTTEAWPAMTAMAYDPTRPGALGRPLPGQELRVIEETGEIALRAPAVGRRAYLAGAGEPAPAEPGTFADGWVRTGDLGYLDDDGYLYLVGRRSEMVNTGGFNVPPAEVEAVLAEHPAVAEVGVGGLPHPTLGEVLAAAVVPRPTSGRPGSGTGPGGADLVTRLRDWLPDRLAAHKRPMWIVPVPELPRNALGKVIRPRLRELLRSEVAAAEAAAGHVPPRTDLEHRLAATWSELLPAGAPIGVHDDFFRRGGHSLAATALLARIRQHCGVELSLREFSADPTIAALAKAVAAHPDYGRTPAGPAQPDAGAAARPSGHYPLSPYQRRFWFLEHLAAGEPAYPVFGVRRLTGPLRADALERAVADLVARHAALRTTFPLVDDEPVQVVAEQGGADLVVLDLVDRPDRDRTALAREALREALAAPFDLAAGPLLRVRLVRLAADEHLLAMNLPHIVVDDASFGILWRELGQRYQELAHGVPPAPAPATAAVPVDPGATSYGKYAAWLAEPAQQQRLRAQLDYWTGQLAGAPALLELPTDRPRPPVQSFRGGSHRFTLPAGLTAALHRRAEQRRLTSFQLLLGIFQLLLLRYSGQPEVVVGAPVSRRLTADVARTVGLFVNTVAIRAGRTGDPSVGEFLSAVQASCEDALTHGDVPFEQVIQALRPARDASYPPVCQVMFALVDAFSPMPLGPAVTDRSGQSSGWEAELLDTAPPARFDLTLWLRPDGDRLVGAFDYNADLFEPATIARMSRHLIAVAEAVAADPDRRLAQVSLLCEEERRALVEGGGQRRRYDRRPVTELIAEAAAADPGAPAVLSNLEPLSYRELERRANRLAHQLRDRGVGPEDPVGLALPAGPDAIVAVLGILRAGGAYLPVDPTHPAARQAQLLTDAGVRVLVTTGEHADRFADFDGALVRLDRPAGTEPDPGPPAAVAHPSQAAYVIYTSGSTGTPKGVVVEHRALTNLTHGFREIHGFAPTDRVLMIPPLSFDASVGDIFPVLASGAALVIHPEPGGLSGRELLRLSARRGITIVDAPSALWQQWADDLADVEIPADHPLRMVMMGGEGVPVGKVRRWARSTRAAVPVVNHYGPTEATVCATTYRTLDAAELGDAAWLPIGEPVPNVRCYVLDDWGEPVPEGVAGELYLGGAGVARGYLGRPRATAERFVPDRFGDPPGGRLYRTGDRARWLDGKLEFLGRADDQVKVRGHRIEPAEVEAALLTHPQVREAVVLARPGGRLTGYLVAAPTVELSTVALREHLRGRLPEYLIPGQFTQLAELPRTRHGKVDRAALPDPAGAGADRPAYRPPTTGTERALASVWQEVLGLDPANPVGRDDSFFDLGGHSLLALAVISRARGALGVEVPVSLLFQAGSLAEFAALVDAAGAQPPGRTTTGGRPGLDLRADAVLPDDVCADLGGYRPGQPVAAALLTGATGFLGAFLLADLLRTTGATIHCLVRASSTAEGTARITENLRRYGLWRPEYADRIRPLPGDLSRPRLGCDEQRFAALAEELDVIYHNGSLVDFVRPYPDLRPANVDGTREVLRLAGSRRTTPVHFVSTLGVFLADAYRSRLVTEAESPADPDGLGSGYNQSKWVADTMVSAAARRGLPVTIHRPARITGDSRTGVATPDDYFSRLLKTFVQLESVPQGGHRIDMAPVDWVSATIVHISRQESATGGRFHYYNHATTSYDEIAAALRGHGFPVTRQPYPQWRERLLARLAAAEQIAMGPLAAALPRQQGPDTGPSFDCAQVLQYAVQAGYPCPPADRALLARYLDFFVGSGFLPAGHR